MPSLHTAFATLIALFIGARLRSRWRYLLALYPLAMGFSLVYLGEHYVIDVVAGYGYAIGVYAAVSWWERRRASREVARHFRTRRRAHDLDETGEAIAS
jgi:membrane-associated phospholipid phosphatase